MCARIAIRYDTNDAIRYDTTRYDEVHSGTGARHMTRHVQQRLVEAGAERKLVGGGAARHDAQKGPDGVKLLL